MIIKGYKIYFLKFFILKRLNIWMLFLSTVPWLKDHSHNSKIQHKIHWIYEVKPHNKLPLVSPLYIIPPLNLFWSIWLLVILIATTFLFRISVPGDSEVMSDPHLTMEYRMGLHWALSLSVFITAAFLTLMNPILVYYICCSIYTFPESRWCVNLFLMTLWKSPP